MSSRSNTPPARERPAAVEASSHERLLARMAQPLLEDERLRGDLEDDAFKPLLDWALAAAERCAREALAAADPDAHAAACGAGLRRLVGSAAALAACEAGGDLARLVGPPIFAPGSEAAVRERLRRAVFGADPAANARAIVAALSAPGASTQRPTRRAKQRRKTDGAKAQNGL